MAQSSTSATTKSTSSSKDRITRFASPSRYDYTMTPKSFLDSRSKRSSSRDSLDKGPSNQPKQSGDVIPLTTRGRQPNNNNIPLPGPNKPLKVSKFHRDSDAVRLQEQVESLGRRVKYICQKNSRPIATDTEGKLNSSISVDAKLTSVTGHETGPEDEEDSGNSAIVAMRRRVSADTAGTFISQLSELPPSNDAVSTRSTETHNVTAVTQSGGGRVTRPEITKIHSRVHKRILIQTGSTTQAKTFTYQHYAASKQSNSEGVLSSSEIPTGGLYSLGNLKNGDSSLADSELDNLAIHMGLLKESDPCGSSDTGPSSQLFATPTTSGIPSHTSSPAHHHLTRSELSLPRPETATSTRSTPQYITNTQDNNSVQRASSAATASLIAQTEMRGVKQPHKRTRTGGGLLFGLLRRFSPGMKRRSKSFSPTRMHRLMESSPNSGPGLLGVDENSTKHSRSNSHDTNEEVPVQTSHSSTGGKISRLFRSKRSNAEKKHSRTTSSEKVLTPSSTWSASHPETSNAVAPPTYSGKERLLLDSLSRDRVGNPYEQLKQQKSRTHVPTSDSGPMGTSSSSSATASSRHSLNSTVAGNVGGAVRGMHPGAGFGVGVSRPAPHLDLTRQLTNNPQEHALTNGDANIPGSPTPVPSPCSFVTPPAEPPRYLGVSVSAFGYSAYNYKSPDPQQQQQQEPPQPHLPVPPVTSTVSNVSSVSSSSSSTLITYKGAHEVASSQSHPKVISHHEPSMDDDVEEQPSDLMSRSLYHKECCTGDVSGTDSCLEPAVEIRRRERTRSTSEEKEARQRSSLIIMQVAQASPRTKCNIVAGVATTPNHNMPHFPLDFSTGSLTRSFTASEHSSSPAGTFFGEHRPISTGISPLNTPTTPGFSFLEHLQPIGEVSKEDAPVLGPSHVPVEEEMAESSRTEVPGQTSLQEDTSTTTTMMEEQKDGRYFLLVVAQVEAQLLDQIHLVERDLADPDVQAKLSEEVDGQLRTAVGKANLLLKDKFAQFRGLCEENLHQQALQEMGVNIVSRCGESNHFVTLGSDLEGFWAMVQLQVDDVTRMFTDIAHIRDNHWIPLPTEVHQPPSANRRRPPVARKKTSIPASNASNDISNSANNDKEKENLRSLEAKKRLMAAKREAMLKMKQKSMEASGTDQQQQEVAIFH